MEYKEIELPDYFNGYDNMSPKQAADFFDWYVSSIDDRLRLLNSMILSDCGKILDYSLDSLITIWDWYETKISYKNLTEAEYSLKKKDYPSWMQAYVSQQDLSRESIVYGLDVAIYFAQVMINSTGEKIQWGYYTKPKSRAYCNQPVLLGFSHNKPLNPRVVIINCALKSLEEKNPKRLLDMYDTWKKFL